MFIRKKSTIIVVKLVLSLYLVLKRDECRPEDNIDDDTIVLNEQSGEKSQLAREDLMDGLTGQNNGLNSRGIKKKI